MTTRAAALLKSLGLGILAAVLSGLAPALAQKAVPRLEQVKAAGLVRVCIWPDYYAITFRNPRRGQLEGLDIDLSQALAADLGVGLAHIESSFTRFAEDLERDRCDVAMFGVAVTEARAAQVDFTQPYLRSGVHAVTTKTSRRIREWGDIDQRGIVCAVQRGTFMERVMRDYLKQAQLLVIDPPKTREVEVQSGRADVFVTDYPYGRRMLFQHEWARLVSPPQPIAPTPYAYAVKKGEPEWLARLDAFVAAIKRDGRLAAAARRHAVPEIVLE